ILVGVPRGGRMEFWSLVFNRVVKYEGSSNRPSYYLQIHREGVRLGGRGLHLWRRQILHWDEQMLAALALKAVLFHVLGKICKLRPRLRLHPLPREEARNQCARKSKESEVLVEQSKHNPESNSEKYGCHGNPNVVHVDRAKSQNLSKQPGSRRNHRNFLGVLALALGACQIHLRSPFLKFFDLLTCVAFLESETATKPAEMSHASANPR